MEKSKNLETLRSELFELPKESLFQIQGGYVASETRFKTWTEHGGHEDMDGYKSDEHVG